MNREQSDRVYIGKKKESDWLKKATNQDKKEKKTRMRLIGQEEPIGSESTQSEAKGKER